ncbi:hypothetical protein Srot_1950 [Segniliparus rotundus DSM 44985]|uniref:Uncharacterized protein n=1 Tax=Segniliparus rotundus (strain ATCC BAA-972 / CDC 1076 / CIP 108378 / DSM 44985 / JCM 13578) TaxID=640132 RepID=D6Z8X7_SEGRD|nr:hypothetical protein [Segniliparus rotundus]ADG98407.1 hypothetical protein Srot_1950 [Segniliparus rotundus DSM 44985]
MAEQTNVSTSDLSGAAMRIIEHHSGLQAVFDKWHNATSEFHGHAGDDGVDGQLKSQSETALDDNRRGGDVAARRAGQAGESANEAADTYTARDEDGSASIATVGNAIPK